MRAGRERIEAFLEAERAQLPPWFVVGFGTGIAAWFALGTSGEWKTVIAAAAVLSVAGFLGRSGRAERAIGWFALAVALGCALAWARAEWVAAPRLQRSQIVTFNSRVEKGGAARRERDRARDSDSKRSLAAAAGARFHPR